MRLAGKVTIHGKQMRRIGIIGEIRGALQHRPILPIICYLHQFTGGYLDRLRPRWLVLISALKATIAPHKRQPIAFPINGYLSIPSILSMEPATENPGERQSSCPKCDP